MGYIRHHSIIVTSHEKEIKLAHKRAIEIFGNGVSEIKKYGEGLNGYNSFFIPPDGSKEGWGDSDIGDKRRSVFVNWINEQAFDDGSNMISYVEVFYGDDEGESKILNHN